MPPIVFCTRWGNIRLMCCFRGIARSHVFKCVLHALRQYQTNELLLWYRPNLVLSIVCYMHWGNIKLAECFCGIAQIHFLML